MEFETTITEIAELTQYNSHSEAYLLGAKLLGSEILVKKFELFIQIWNLESGMDKGTADFQYYLYEQLLSYARTKLNNTQYDLFYGAFWHMKEAFITFTNDEGKELGKLIETGGILDFEGDATASAKQFFDDLLEISKKNLEKNLKYAVATAVENIEET